MHALIRTVGTIADTSLNHSSQLYAALHILALDKLEDDIALRRTGIEALIPLLIVFLHRNNGVLSHRYIEIILGTVHTEGIGLEATSHLSCRQGIGMHGDKEIGIGTVGNIRTLIERDEDIRLAGIDDSYLREILLHILTEAQGNGKIDILFLGYGSECSGIMTTMTGVDNQRKSLIGGERRHDQHTHQSPYQCYFLTHTF